jgi:hypothetical protein
MIPGAKELESWQEKMWTALETLDPNDEGDKVWRHRFLTAQDAGREKVYAAWLEYNNVKLKEAAK